MSITSEAQLEDKAQQMRIPLNSIHNKDELPKLIRPGAYIINLQDSKTSSGVWNPGSHWVGLWIEPPYAVYFDPFGLAPPANVQLFIHRFDEMYPTRQVQNEYSGWCGYYTLLFLYYMSHQRKHRIRDRLDHFMRLWSHHPQDNLKKLKGYFRYILR